MSLIGVREWEWRNTFCGSGALISGFPSRRICCASLRFNTNISFLNYCVVLILSSFAVIMRNITLFPDTQGIAACMGKEFNSIAARS